MGGHRVTVQAVHLARAPGHTLTLPRLLEQPGTGLQEVVRNRVREERAAVERALAEFGDGGA